MKHLILPLAVVLLVVRNQDVDHNQCSAGGQGEAGEWKESKRDHISNLVPANNKSDLLVTFNTI